VKEVLRESGKVGGSSHVPVDLDDLLDDPELERLHAERLAALKAQAEERLMEKRGHTQSQVGGNGRVDVVSEGEFLEIVTNTPNVLVHFFHHDFLRCKIMDKHLGTLANKYIRSTRFIKVSAPESPFFTEKLQVRTLPCLLSFVNGIAVDRVVGFDELGAKDDFSTAVLEKRLALKSSVLNKPRPLTSTANASASASDEEDDEDDKRYGSKTTIRYGLNRTGFKNKYYWDED
jgi:thioredoxin-like negative regulator of GroEL